MVRWNAVEDTRGLYLCNVFYTEPMQQQRIAGKRTETEEGASVNFVFTGVLFDSRLSRMKDFTNKYNIYIYIYPCSYCKGEIDKFEKQVD